MIQDIIVYVIIAAVVGWAFYLLARRIRGVKSPDRSCGCTECPLKGNCKNSDK